MNIHLLLLILSTNLKGQLDSSNFASPSIICGSRTGIKIYAINGIIFEPENLDANYSNSKKIYLSDKLKINLEGLELNKEQFLKIILEQKHVARKRGLYNNQSFSSITADSLGITNMSISLNIPINLNGTELSVNEREEILKKIKSEDIVSVRRKKSLFRKSIIEVVTK